jgi:YidC/Oxa1 family membrane protein insertase
MALPLANIFQPIINVFEQVLLFFHNTIGLGWGLSIIALTVAVRLVLVPLTVKQFRSMQAMQQLQPQIKALQEKYKDDKARLNQETMKFYQENKVNPFASCLPLLMQMPVFISLFYMLRKDLKEDICGSALKAAAPHHEITSAYLQNTTCDDVHHPASFLFIPDVTSKATGAVLVVLIVMYIGSQLLSSVLMASATADKNQRTMMIALPFVFTIFILRFPSGLLVYWITTNLWTVGQQRYVRRGALPPPEPFKPAGDGNGAAPGGAGGGLMERLAGRANAAAKPAGSEPAAVGASSPASAPPPPPRKKKKRSGRRR